MIRTKLTLDPRLFDEVLVQAETAPAHRVNILKGPATPKDDKLQWIGNVYTDDPAEYEHFDISGLRNISLHFPRLAFDVVGKLNEMTGLGFLPTQMAIVRTNGSIAIHKDIGDWKCKINFGIRNSSYAETWMYDDTKTLTSIGQLEDGVGFLLDSSQYHSVEAKTNMFEYRYFVTFVSQLTATQVAEHLSYAKLL